MGKAKKIIAGVLVVAVAGTGIGAGLMQLRKNSQKEVEVTPVSGLLQEYYQQSTNLDGQIASSATQTVTGDKDLVVDQVFVSKGDNVKKDDPLISFDTTLVEMELNIAKLKKQKQEQDLTKAANRLNSLLNGGPVQESDSGTDADNTLNTTTGSDSEGDDDMTPDSAMSSAADFSGNYLAAAIHPYLLAAFVAEAVFTFIFVLTVLGTTDRDNSSPHFAGLAIGLTLVLVHIVCIPVTGTSVNPARSIGPALFAGVEAISQLWLFIVAPIVGAVVAVPVWKTIKGN